MSKQDDKWYPDRPETELEYLQQKVNKLERDNARMQKRAIEDSWARNPDTSGGSFTQWEIDNATAWR